MRLEVLENRTVLSNVTISFPTPSGPLTITGDTSNDNFTITENTTPGPLFGTVTIAPGATRVVPGVGVVPGSTIEGGSTPFTTGSAVTSIIVGLPGTSNYDYLTLSGGGKTTATTVQNVTVTATGADLTFAAGATATNGVDNSGNFVLLDNFTSSVDAVLTANVDNSSFAAVSITQTGGGPDSTDVELGDDDTGNVTISEGGGSGDTGTVTGGTVSGTITISQTDAAGNPLGDSATISGVTAGGTGAISQGGASGDSATVEDGTAGGNTSISQGSGPADDARVDDELENAAGNLSISQGSGPADAATVVNSSRSNVRGNVTISEGGGSGDRGSVTGGTVSGTITISQTDAAGNPLGDSATISGVTAGGTAPSARGASGDSATVEDGTAGATPPSARGVVPLMTPGWMTSWRTRRATSASARGVAPLMPPPSSIVAARMSGATSRSAKGAGVAIEEASPAGPWAAR